MARNAMYERFTDRARKVMQLANQEAQHFNQKYIGTEHVLLGMIDEGFGVAANVLKNLDVDVGKVRYEVEKLAQTGPHMVTMGQLPSPEAKRFIEYSIEEARDLNHGYVGTEHLLLALMRDQDFVGAQVLMNQGLKLEEIRGEVLNLLGHGIESAEGTERDTQGEEFGVKLIKVPKLGPQIVREGHFDPIRAGNRPAVLVLAWLFLALGTVGIWLGILGREIFLLPSVVLIGFCLIALAVARR